MKLEHLIQAYNFNKIKVEAEEIEDDKEKAGILKFNNDINASYLLDNEGIVIVLNLFCNCLTSKDKKINNQLEHTINVLTIVQKTIELLGNTKQEEANNILKQLGLFNGKLEKKAVRFTDHIYKLEIIEGLLMLCLISEQKNKIMQTNTPVKSERKNNVMESGCVEDTV